MGAHTVAENIILGSVKGIIDRRTYEKKIQDLALTYGFDMDPAAVVNDLPVGVQQKVEILKALFQDARMLIMDEPTAVLTPQEALSLMDFVRRYAAAGNSAIFITHKLKEVMAVADRIIVMRSGEVRGAVPRSGTDEKELSMMMIGRDLPPLPTSPLFLRVREQGSVWKAFQFATGMQSSGCGRFPSRSGRERFSELREFPATAKGSFARPYAAPASLLQAGLCSTTWTSPASAYANA